MIFSKASEIALRRAAALAREDKAQLLLVHVITDSAAKAPFHLRRQFYDELEKEAGAETERFLRRSKLGKTHHRFLLVRGESAAALIARQAKKSRSSMIIMGSRGRSGLKRLILGSEAEKVIRYASCPVLIVKS